MIIPALYHWSPTERKEQIQRDGLKPYCDCVTHSSGRAPYLCFSPTTSLAWVLSGDIEWTKEIESWDLWQMHIISTDEVHVRPMFGGNIEEVKIYNAISAERLWYVATREPSCFQKT